jgi:hypothetical protein
MKRSITTIVCVLFAVMAFLYSCKTDPPLSGTEHISTTYVIATDLSDLSIDTFVYVNFDYNQGLPARYIDSIRLKAHTTYSVRLKLLEEAVNPTQDLTDSITAMGDKHLMLYNMDPTSGMISVKIIDKDSKGLPIGLMSTWKTSDTTSGYLRLILRHQPGVKNGTQTPGLTDFEADYPVVVR